MNITNDKVTEYIEGLYKPINEFLGALRDDSIEKNVPIIMKDTETFILNLIKIKKPLRILEIGTAVGYSALCFASVSKEVEITSLEVSPEMYEIALKNIEKAGFSGRIHVVLGDAKDSLQELKEKINGIDTGGYDMVFIDAAKAQYKAFWDDSIDLCKSGTVIISDNVLLKARTASDDYITKRRQKTSVRRMREYLKYITNLDYADTAVLSVGDGVAVSVLRG